MQHGKCLGGYELSPGSGYMASTCSSISHCWFSHQFFGEETALFSVTSPLSMTSLFLFHSTFLFLINLQGSLVLQACCIMVMPTASRFFFPSFYVVFLKSETSKGEETMMVRASFRIQDSENLGVVC